MKSSLFILILIELLIIRFPLVAQKIVAPETEGITEAISWKGEIYYTALSPTTGQRTLGRTDGTSAGTELLSEGLGLDILTPVGDKLFFGTGILGVYDFQSNTAYQMRASDDDRPYAANEQVALGNVLLFRARPNNASYDWQLWRSDGTDAGTYPITSVTAQDDEGPYGLFQSGPYVYFFRQYRFAVAGGSTEQGRRLYRTDGTASGTILLRSFPGSISTDPENLIELNGKVLFNGYSPAEGVELWQTDGTPEGTELVHDTDPAANGPSSVVNGGFRYPAKLGSRVYYQGNSGRGNGFGGSLPGHGLELWTTDGTDAGTYEVKDLNPLYEYFANLTNSSSPELLTSHNNKLYLLSGLTPISTPRIHGPGPFQDNVLWESDGTAAGTNPVKPLGINGPGTFGYFTTSIRPGKRYRMVGVGSQFFFVGGSVTGSGSLDQEIWRSDGTASGTVQLRNLYNAQQYGDRSPSSLFAHDNKLYFIHWQQTDVSGNHSRFLFVYDPACTLAAPTVTVSPSALYCAADAETVTLTALGCNGVVQWNNGATGATLTPNITAGYWFEATCVNEQTGCVSNASAPIYVDPTQCMYTPSGTACENYQVSAYSNQYIDIVNNLNFKFATVNFGQNAVVSVRAGIKRFGSSAASVPQDNTGRRYLPRYHYLTCGGGTNNCLGGPFTEGPVKVRLYYRNSELNTFNTAIGSSITRSQLSVVLFDPPVYDCVIDNNAGSYSVIIPPSSITAVPYGSSGFYLEFDAPRYGEMGATYVAPVIRTVSSIASGNWNLPGTWDCTCIPTATDVVQIRHIVTLPDGYQGHALQLIYDGDQQLVFGAGAQLQLGSP